MLQCMALLLLWQEEDRRVALQGALRQWIDEVNALPGPVAEVLHGAYPISIADQQMQHGGIAVHRFHRDGGKTVFSGPCFLAIQQTLRQPRLAVGGQHATEPAI